MCVCNYVCICVLNIYLRLPLASGAGVPVADSCAFLYAYLIVLSATPCMLW